MEIRYVTIKLTNKADDNGYRTGIVTCYDDDDKELNSWICDSFWLHGNLQCDFETEGGVKIWALNGQGLRVESGYTTRIWTTNKTTYLIDDAR